MKQTLYNFDKKLKQKIKELYENREFRIKIELEFEKIITAKQSKKYQKNIDKISRDEIKNERNRKPINPNTSIKT